MNQSKNLEILLRSLRLPTMLREKEPTSRTAEKEGWSYFHYLQALCEQEVNERARRRIERNLKISNLPDGKTMETFDQKKLSPQTRRQLSTLLEGSFVERAENILAFGLPGRGKTHLLSAIAREMIVQKGYQAKFYSTYGLVQMLLRAKKELMLDTLLKKLDKFDVIVLDDIGYVQQDRAEMEVLFTFLSERYERRSLMITSNLVFSQWDKIFKDPMTTAAAIDRLIHHSIILELNMNSHRMEEANKNRKKSDKIKEVCNVE